MEIRPADLEVRAVIVSRGAYRFPTRRNFIARIANVIQFSNALRAICLPSKHIDRKAKFLIRVAPIRHELHAKSMDEAGNCFRLLNPAIGGRLATRKQQNRSSDSIPSLLYGDVDCHSDINADFVAH